jgi:hypothetical protein
MSLQLCAHEKGNAPLCVTSQQHCRENAFFYSPQLAPSFLGKITAVHQIKCILCHGMLRAEHLPNAQNTFRNFRVPTLREKCAPRPTDPTTSTDQHPHIPSKPSFNKEYHVLHFLPMTAFFFVNGPTPPKPGGPSGMVGQSPPQNCLF